jgi:hypothetical protein
LVPSGIAVECGMVPVERIELPTNGLQNRCSTAELNRRASLFNGENLYNQRTDRSKMGGGEPPF